MKKVSLFALGAASLALLMTSCGEPAPSAPETVAEVQVQAVVPENVNENAVALPEGDAGKTVFEEKVVTSIAEELTGSISSLIPSGTGDTQIQSARSITPSTLSEDFANFPKSFKSDGSAETGNMSITGSWSARTGEMDFGELDVKGLKLNIDALSVSLDYRSSVAPTTYVTTVTTNASAKAAVRYELDGFSETLKKAKVNILGYANATGVNAVTDPKKVSNIDITQGMPSMTAAMDSISGVVGAYYGMNGAVYFEVPVQDATGKEVIYNGVLKSDISLGCAQTLSLELIKKLESVIATVSGLVTSSMSGMQTASSMPDIPALLAAIDEAKVLNIKADISVYDTKSSKLFSYIEADSLSEFYKQGEAFANSIMALMSQNVSVSDTIVQ